MLINFKTKIILILTLSSIFAAKSQFIYTKQEGSTLFFNNIIEKKNSSNYLIVCVKQSKIPNSFFNKLESKLLIINQQGNLVDSLGMDSNFVLSRPFLFFNNHYYFSGTLYKYYPSNNYASFITLLKFDLNLNLVKKTVLDSLYNQYPDNIKSIQTNNSIYTSYSVGAPSTNFKVFKLGLNLVKKDSTLLIGEDMVDIENYDNTILISGTNFPQSGINTSLQVAELDTSFNVLSRFNIDSLTYISICGQKVGLSGFSANLNYLGSKKYMLTGSYLVCSPPTSSTQTLFKLKTITSIVKNNNKVQSTVITALPGLDHYRTAQSTACSLRNSLVFSTALVTNSASVNIPDTTNTTQIQVQCVDSAGTLKWVKYLGGDMYYFPTCIYATADSGAIVCGIRYDTAAPKIKNVTEAFVMKIDKNGNQVFVGIQQNGKINTHYHKIYPNPSQNQIHFDIPLQTNIEIVIYDLLGKEEKRIESYKNLSPLDISELKPGTHIYKIKTTTGVFSGKFIKE
jgi:hypothetical protein